VSVLFLKLLKPFWRPSNDSYVEQMKDCRVICWCQHVQHDYGREYIYECLWLIILYCTLSLICTVYRTSKTLTSREWECSDNCCSCFVWSVWDLQGEEGKCSDLFSELTSKF